MKDYNQIKEQLFAIMRDMNENKTSFVVTPQKDCLRNRKLGFEKILKFILSLEAGSINEELLKYFSYTSDVPSASAFCQQRAKILPETFYYLFRMLNQYFPCSKTYRGYQLVACDGSKCIFYPDSKDKEHYVVCNSYSAMNEMHLNALYDLLEHRYLDAIIQPEKRKHEQVAFCEMIDRFTPSYNTLFIADRGYETYNTIMHILKKDFHFLIRVKDKASNGILHGISLPDGEFDCIVPLTLSRKFSSQNRKENRVYKRISTAHRIDYMDELDAADYDIDLRVIRINLGDDKYEVLITNLAMHEFTTTEIKDIYHMRWGIETSFRDLKYSLALTHFHAKKAVFVKQEIFARIVMYNFSAIIASYVQIKKEQRKHKYQLNFIMVIQICRNYLKSNRTNDELEALILKYLLPVRPGRRYKRTVTHKGNQSFLYRT